MNKTYIFLGIIAVIPILLFTIYPQEEAIPESAAEGLKGTGQYTVYVKDSMGAITQIRQSPNAVVNLGENCFAKMIFGSLGGDTVGTGVCTGEINQGFRYMALDEDAQILVTDKELRDPADSAGLSTYTKAAITWNQNSTGSSDALSKVTIRLSNTFTNAGADETIVGVGLFNDTSASTRGMLSKANFTGVLVTTGSDLTVNYDFEIGGGTVP